MFAGMIQLAAKQGRGKELTKLMMERSLPVLKQQPGFVEAIVLTPENEQDQVVGISIWNSKADADRFAQGQSQQLLERQIFEDEILSGTERIHQPSQEMAERNEYGR